MAFEAYETRAMANYLANGTTWCADCDRGEGEGDEGKRPGRRVRAFVDLHSYGQLCKDFFLRTMAQLTRQVMFPFAHSCDDFPPDAEMLMEAGLGVAKTMRRQQGEGYQAGQACDLTYRCEYMTQEEGQITHRVPDVEHLVMRSTILTA